MAKTAGLVGLAVILAVIMLNIIDKGGSPKVATKPGATTTTSSPTSTTRPGATTTTAKPRAIRTRAEVRIVVMNAGSFTGAATKMQDALTKLGYKNNDIPGNLPKRKGSAVQCVSGFGREAIRLKLEVANKAVIEAFPAPRPTAVAASIDCIVVLGSA